MARFIDADRALEIVYERGIAHPNAYYLTNYAMAILQEAPTVDVVEVIRCRDCKWSKRDTLLDKYWCKHFLSEMEVRKNDYCSYGEKKNNDK